MPVVTDNKHSDDKSVDIALPPRPEKKLYKLINRQIMANLIILDKSKNVKQSNNKTVHITTQILTNTPQISLTKTKLKETSQ